MKWFRWHHGTVEAGVWRLVAQRSRQPVHVVVAVWALMYERASRSTPRGTISGWDDEAAGAALDLDPSLVSAIRAAMQGKALDGERMLAWEQEQPKREREDDSKERVRAFRQRQRGSVTPAKNEQRPVTPRNATSRPEESREEEIETTLHSVEDGGGAPSLNGGAERMPANQLLGAWINRQRRVLGKPDYRPSPKEAQRYGAVAARIVAAHPGTEVQAAFVGMDSMWPHAPPKSEPWTLETLEKKFAAALAASMNHPAVAARRADLALDRALEDL